MALLLLAFHALNLIILNHNPIHPELIRGSLSQYGTKLDYVKTDYINNKISGPSENFVKSGFPEDVRDS